MGFYIRKSLSVGPFRSHLNKSGLGLSTGIKGFGIGTGPRGNYAIILPVILFLLLSVGSLAQTSASRNRRPKHFVPISLSIELTHGVNLPHNSLEILRKEVMDTNLLALIAESVGIPKAKLATIELSTDLEWETSCACYADDGYDLCRVCDQLARYVAERKDGHTKECLHAGLTNRILPRVTSDLDLYMFATNYPLLPISWVKKISSGGLTNNPWRISSQKLDSMSLTSLAALRLTNPAASLITNFLPPGRRNLSFQELTNFGNRGLTNFGAWIPTNMEVMVARRTTFELIDGEVGWRYTLEIDHNNALISAGFMRFDAKEADPHFRETLEAVEKEVMAGMERPSTGRVGNVVIRPVLAIGEGQAKSPRH